MQNNQDYFPWQGEGAFPEPKTPKKNKLNTAMWLSILCVVVAVTILLTYTLTAASNRKYYTAQLQQQQAVIESLKNAESEFGFEKLEIMAKIFSQLSYYSGKVGEEELLTAVLKAYAEATGDDYAEYYTNEEYAAMNAENIGEQVGIGVSVVQQTQNIEGYEYQVFQVIAVYPNAPAEAAGILVGDLIYAIKINESYQTVAAIGGFSAALSAMKGPRGSVAEIKVLRPEGVAYTEEEFKITRGDFETQSVGYFKSSSRPNTGVVRISSFDLTTPNQFKAAVKALQVQGVTKFVFDVRNNPGGDLQSIKAVLTYFLNPGDLILSAIDKDGKVARSYVAEAMRFADEYAACNVAENEIGMFKGLDMVVLCNGNTASAAEVFTATLRDYGLATIVGETTFGKGIMQSFLPLSAFGDYTGYVKMTTYAYVTKCGVTYHEIGVAPHEGKEVALSKEAQKYNFYLLPEELDNQLQTAFGCFA